MLSWEGECVITDKEALERVITLLSGNAKGVSPALSEWWERHEGTLWVLESMLEALEDDE